MATSYVGFAEPPRAQAAERTTLDNLVTDGPVQAIAADARQVYVGGSFGYVGPRTGGVVALSAASGNRLRRFAAIEGIVSSVIPDGSGGFFVAGALGNGAPTATRPVAHVLPNGRLDPAFRATVRGSASALVLAGGRLYLAGVFGSPVSGVRVIALDSATGRRDPAFGVAVRVVHRPFPPAPAVPVPPGAPCSGGFRFYPVAFDAFGVAAMAISRGRLFLGGAFDRVNGIPRDALAAVALDTGRVDESFRPSTIRPDMVVRAIASADGRLFIGGRFGSRLGGLVALDASNGALDSQFAARAGNVASIAIGDGRVYAAESGRGSPALTAFDAQTGATVSRFGTVPLRWAGAVAIDRARLYAVGELITGGYGIVAIDRATGRLMQDPARTDQPAWALAPGRGLVYVGGPFTSAGGYAKPGLVAFERPTRRLVARFGQTRMREVSAIATARGRVFGSGVRSAHGQRTPTVVAFEPRTGRVLRRFRPPATGAGGWALAHVGGRVFSASRHGGPLFAFDAMTGRRITTFDAPPGDVSALTSSGRRLFVLTHRPDRVTALDARTGTPLWRYDGRSRDRGWWQFQGGISVTAGAVYVSEHDEPDHRRASRYRLRALDVDTGQPNRRFYGPNIVANHVVSAGRGLIVAGTGTGSPVLALRANGAPDRRFIPPEGSSACAVFTLHDDVYAGGLFGQLGARHRLFFAALALPRGRPAQP